MIINYITTNKLNSKQYIGMHLTKNIDDGYLGSGTALKLAIKKYGRKNFTKEILYICENPEKAFYNEGEFIKEYNTLSPKGYNISPTGGAKGKGSISEETKRKMSEVQKINQNQKIIENI